MLNTQQTEAVEHEDGPLLVLAGAGAGKTRIVTQRICRLIERGVPANKIVAVTFTNKAAEEMRERVRTLSNEFVLIATFHSLCTRILRESIEVLGYGPDFAIYDEDDSQKLTKACLDELGLREKPKKVRNMISRHKNSLTEPTDAVYHLYQKRLKEYNALDFDDLLLLTLKLFREHPQVLERYQERWSHVLVDEYQDTNQAQYLIARMLVEKSTNLFVVGDPDQSIYSWRGANIENILGFEKDFPGSRVVRLEQNYRSTNQILQASNTLIKRNVGRYEKELWSDLGDGEPIEIKGFERDRDEAQWVVEQIEWTDVPLNETVIFYRTNAQSRQFEDALLRARIPYVIVGGLSFYQRREIKDILAYLRVVANGTDYLAFARSLNAPKRGIGSASLDKLRFAADRPIFDFCRDCAVDLKLPKRAREGLADYIRLIERLRTIESLPDLVSEAIHSSGYLAYLKEDPETFQDRRENLEELIAKSREGGSLTTFLEELALKGTLDEAADGEHVRLMTIHNGKGLEFRTVFLVGMEEGLFPHINSKGDTDAVEEERRLCYVGMTRAKERLYMTHARFRFVWGSPQRMVPSRFLGEFTSTSTFSEGDQVTHDEFGAGTIESIAESSLGPIYRVYFESQGATKTLVAQYASLQKI